MSWGTFWVNGHMTAYTFDVFTSLDGNSSYAVTNALPEAVVVRSWA